MYRAEEIEAEYFNEIDEKTRQLAPARCPRLEDYESGDGGFLFWGRLKDRIALTELDDNTGLQG